MRVPEDVIPCGVLAEARGYPTGYGIAERVLQREGWHYLIAYDAWIAPHVPKPRDALDINLRRALILADIRLKHPSRRNTNS